MKLLIVDDEEYVRKSTGALIDSGRIGITEILEASSAKIALQIINLEHPDIAIIDMNMPGMNGAELLKTIRESGNHIKVLVISGYDEFSYCQQAIHYGAEDYLLKPINPEEINDALFNISRSILKTNNSAEVKNTDALFDVGKAENHLISSFSRFIAQYPTHWISAVRVSFMKAKDAIKKTGDQELAYIEMMQKLKAEHKGSETVKSLFSDEIYWLIPFSDERYKSKEETFDALADICRSVSVKMKEKGTEIIFGIAIEASHEVEITQLRERATASVLKGNLLDSYHILAEKKNAGTGVALEIAKTNFVGLVANAMKLGEKSLVSGAMAFLETRIADEGYVSLSFYKSVWQDVCKTCDLNGTKLSEVFECLDSRNIQSKMLEILLDKCREVKRTNHKIDPIMLEVYAYIVNNCCSKITLSSLSEKYFFSTSYLCKNFKKAFGMNITKFLIDLRLNRAIMLIEKTNVPVSEIASLTGFNDSSYFIKIFREKYGKTPYGMRKGNNMGNDN